MNKMNCIEQLKLHEGFRGDYYQCTANKKTIGYGRNVENNPFTADECKLLGLPERSFSSQPMTETEAELILANDFESVSQSLVEKIDLEDHNAARQAVIINMAFNLGVNGLLKFKNMLAAFDAKLYKQAADEMLDSRWAKQVGHRAEELAEQMETGSW